MHEHLNKPVNNARKVRNVMLVKDLQEFLSKFTEANATGTKQGNAISNAVIFVEVKDGHLHEIKRMEVHEHNCSYRWSSEVIQHIDLF